MRERGEWALDEDLAEREREIRFFGSRGCWLLQREIRFTRLRGFGRFGSPGCCYERERERETRERERGRDERERA